MGYIWKNGFGLCTMNYSLKIHQKQGDVNKKNTAPACRFTGTDAVQSFQTR